MSPARLLWVHDRHKRSQVQSEIRWLLNATAAANTGANGGDAAADRLHELQRELNRFATPSGEGRGEGGPVSQMPLSSADFERMMKEKT